MSDFNPKITAFCCHYTSQQTCAEDTELQEVGFPASVTLIRVPCTGKLQISTMLKAFEEGADGVYVVGCPLDKCHNIKGSQRAAKRVGAVKKALQELGVEEGRLEMFHVERGLHPEFIAAGKEMDKRIRAFGPSPFKGEE